MRNEGDTKHQNMEEKEPKLTEAPSDEHVNNYEGPIHRSKTKKVKNVQLHRVYTSIKYSLLFCEHFLCVGKSSQTLVLE